MRQKCFLPISGNCVPSIELFERLFLGTVCNLSLSITVFILCYTRKGLKNIIKRLKTYDQLEDDNSFKSTIDERENKKMLYNYLVL